MFTQDELRIASADMVNSILADGDEADEANLYDASICAAATMLETRGIIQPDDADYEAYSIQYLGPTRQALVDIALQATKQA